jgi:hypothetical protein
MCPWTEIGFFSGYCLLKKPEMGDLVEGRLQQAAGKGPSREVDTNTSQGPQTLIEGALDAINTADKAIGRAARRRNHCGRPLKPSAARSLPNSPG